MRRVLERARRGLYERTATLGTEPVDVRALVVPLRYDVVVRARFFDFLATYPGLSGSELVDEAGMTAYATWFDEIECARYFPELLDDRERRNQRFAERVLGAARLLRSFDEAGFDARHPVTLIRSQADAVADSGAPALGPLHIGDGCHRLSLLLRSRATLEPWMYRVRPQLAPLVDNTALLRKHGVVPELDYVAFLGGRFPVGDAVDLQGAVQRVSEASVSESERLATVLEAQWSG